MAMKSAQHSGISVDFHGKGHDFLRGGVVKLNLFFCLLQLVGLGCFNTETIRCLSIGIMVVDSSVD